MLDFRGEAISYNEGYIGSDGDNKVHFIVSFRFGYLEDVERC